MLLKTLKLLLPPLLCNVEFELLQLISQQRTVKIRQISKVEEKIELLQNQIIHLREECDSKNQLTNLILENVFKSDISKVTSYENCNILLTPNDDYQFPKRFSKSHHQKSSCNSYTHDNRFHALSVNEDSQNSNEDLHITRVIT